MCTVRLDDDQFPWAFRGERKLSDEERTLAFVSDSADSTVDVAHYMSVHASGWKLDAPVAPLLWLTRAPRFVCEPCGHGASDHSRERVLHRVVIGNGGSRYQGAGGARPGDAHHAAEDAQQQ
jgi:hypothetical protein